MTDKKWLDIYSDVAFNGASRSIVEYSPEIKKYLIVQCYCPLHGYCACLFKDVTEQKELEASLKNQEAFYTLAMENIDINTWQYSLETNTAYLTENSARVHHIKSLVLENFPQCVLEMGIVKKESTADFWALTDGLKNGEKRTSKDVWLFDIEKAVYWCERITYIAICDESGKPVRAIGIGKDVTNESRAIAEKRIVDIALENSEIHIWEHDIINKLSIQSSDVMDIFGVPKIIENAPDEEIRLGIICPESANEYRRMHKEIENGAEQSNAEIKMRRPDGSIVWYQLNLTTIFDSAHKPIKAVGCGVDITKSKKLEKQYKEELAYQNAVQSENLIAKVRSNLTKNIVESYVADPGIAVAQVGSSYTESATKLANSAFSQEDRIKLNEVLDRERVLRSFADGQTEYSYSYRRIIDTGSVIWVNTTVKTYQNPENGDVMSFMYSYDINEERLKDGIIKTVTEAEYDYVMCADLKHNTYKLYLGHENNMMMPSSSGDDFEGMVREVNRAVALPEDVERAIYDMSPATILKNLETKKIFSSIYNAYNDDGQVRQKRIEYTYLDKDSQLIIFTRSDVTELLREKQAQQQVLQDALYAAEQANVAKSEFLSRMSHEIRTPMNAIIGMAAIAAQYINDPDQVADCISKIGISSRFLLSLINDILDMSRIESGKMLLSNEEIPFEEFLNGINSICFTQADAKNIDYENIVDPNIADYYVGDAMKLQQVIINILSNAVKFTPENGKVSLQVRQVSEEGGGAILRFTVNDTGCGISEEFIPHLFDAFSQEHSGLTSMYGGTGLGLAISKHMVELMDGKIGVRSIVGVGTEFTIDVKLGISERSRIPRAKRARFDFSQLNALVVDDDVIMCEHSVITLKDMGLKAEWVDSGRQAVERVKLKWAKKEYFDLVLIDWKMPEMDGIETARQIREIVGPDVTIIIMTAYDWTAIEHKAKMAGVNLLICKPIFKTSLISAFQKTLGEHEEDKAPVVNNFDFTGKRLLIAEDHPLNVEVAKKLLECRGFLVEVAENGVRAVEMYAKTPPHYYDAILMDIRMPEMDGLQAANAIRHMSKKTSKTIPIIAMTANAFEDDIKKSHEAGMNAHLAKPIEPQLLYVTLAEQLGML
ncbi:MAG: PAS domain-containing hybrid sensor histidine kinase/response regulator [Clostridia bacterium]|nr:PAS domain-containing hybrid sensor histidine kinase/response regulator [Clostridia bacterium]NLS85015.1 response regulator [Oscillospiraceae bacterium]